MPRCKKVAKPAPVAKPVPVKEKPISTEKAIQVLRDAGLFRLNTYMSRYELFLDMQGKLRKSRDTEERR